MQEGSLRNVQPAEDRAHVPIRRFDQGQEQMLHGNVFVLHPFGFRFGGPQGLIHVGGNIRLPFLAGQSPHLGQLLQDFFRFSFQFIHADPHFGDQLRDQPLRAVQQGKKQVSLLQLLMSPLPGGALGGLDGFDGFLGVTVVAHCISSLSGECRFEGWKADFL